MLAFCLRGGREEGNAERSRGDNEAIDIVSYPADLAMVSLRLSTGEHANDGNRILSNVLTVQPIKNTPTPVL